jgi:hypothetical protein
MPRRLDTLSRRAAGEAASNAQHSAAQALLRLAAKGGIALHVMPPGCRRFTLPVAGRLASPALVIIGCGREPATVESYPAAAAALRWARLSIIRTPEDGRADYQAIGAATAQHRTGVLIETSPEHRAAWQAFAAAAQRDSASTGPR